MAAASMGKRKIQMHQKHLNHKQFRCFFVLHITVRTFGLQLENYSELPRNAGAGYNRLIKTNEGQRIRGDHGQRILFYCNSGGGRDGDETI